jgi:copper chaperone CopZ
MVGHGTPLNPYKMKPKKTEESCCVVSCERPLDQEYWEAQYLNKSTGWDLGTVSPAIKSYLDHLEYKECSILIPGCGTTYEAEYLLEKGFTNITVIDIAPTLVTSIQEKFKTKPTVKVILGDFFEHQGTYDYVLEQTFFCAIPPSLRQKYVWKMHQLLNENGILFGLLFNREFEVSPPFGGNKNEYLDLFSSAFHVQQMDVCENSIEQRISTELFIELKKNSAVNVSLYHFDGMTCSSCAKTITEKFHEIDGVLQVSISSDFKTILLVSKKTIDIKSLEEKIDYDPKYTIHKEE